MKIYEIPIALNIVGGYLAEEGSPLVFLPLKPVLKVEFREDEDGFSLGSIEKFVNKRRLEEVADLLFRHSESKVGVKVVSPPNPILSLCYEGAILAALATYLEVDEELLQYIIEEKVKSSERGLLAGSAICSQVRKPIAYRVGEGYVELELGMLNTHLYMIGWGDRVLLNKITTRVRTLKKSYGDIFEPLFHAFCRLSIKVAEYLEAGDIEKLSYMLKLGHKILSAAGLVSRSVEELTQRTEKLGYWTKLLEDIGQYIFTLTAEDLEKRLKRYFKDLEVYKLYVA